jgi:hypothetical protein
MNGYEQTGKIWNELKKTKKMGPISASWLKPFKNGSQSKTSYQNTEMTVRKDLFQFVFEHFDFSSLTGRHFRTV